MNWVSVLDELPENNEYVIATDLDDTYILKFTQTSDKRNKKKSGYFDDIYDETFLDNITHWMKLPELPKLHSKEHSNEKKGLP